MSSEPSTGWYFIGNRVENNQPTAGGSLGWVCTTTGYANNTPWVASTAYTVGSTVNVGGRVYKCTVGGTSGTTAPTNTSGTAVDGTVTWKYLAPKAVFKVYGSIQA